MALKTIMVYSVLAVFLIAAVGCGDIADVQYPTCPTSFDSKIVKDVVFSSDGEAVTFIEGFNNRLFVGTSNGVLEFSGRELSVVHKCRTSNWDPFEGQFIDKFNGKLWTRNGRNSKLLGYDGTNWISLPISTLPQSSEFTRDDDLSVISGVNTRNESYVQLGKNVWKVTEGYKFEEVKLPQMRCEYRNPDRELQKGCFHSIASSEQSLYIVARADFVSNAVKWDRSAYRDGHADIVVRYENGTSHALTISPNFKLRSKLILSADRAVYIITYSNEIFVIEGDSVRSLGEIGSIQSANLSSDGSLLVYVADVGIFRMTDSWKQIAGLPPVKNLQISQTFLAERDGVLTVGFNYILGSANRRISAEVWQYENHLYKQIFPNSK